VYGFWRQVVTTFNQGEPAPYNLLATKFRDVAVTIAMLNTLATEEGVLIDANAGTIAPALTGIGGSANRRTWP